MPIELVEKYLPYVDEQFTTVSKSELLVNHDFTFDGAHSVRVYKISTGEMTDYARLDDDAQGRWSRYGVIKSLDATTEQFTLSKDRSFTFVIDTLDKDETAQALDAAAALSRQVREVIVPEVDTHVFNVICSGAGVKPAAKALTIDNIYTEIITGSKALDDVEAPETGRVLVVNPDVYYLMKQCKDIVMETEIGNDMRVRGVIGNLDGMTVLRVPASRLPSGFGFLIAHPSATVAPTKLESYKTHLDPPGISGQLVEGRIVYDAFVLENKAKALYYQTVPTSA